MGWIVSLLSILSALAAFAAAALWYKASIVQVPHKDEPGPDGTYPAAITVDGNDFIATAQEQAHWNKWGATAAALAALLQGVVLLTASITSS